MERKTSFILTLRYGVIQGLYWASFGAIVAFASVFLLSKGFSNSQIGIILALSNVFAVLLQPLIASFVDKAKKADARLVVLIFSVFGIVGSLLLLFVPLGLWGNACLYVFVTTSLFTLQPFINALAFAFNTPVASANFGIARGAGSFLYAVVCWALGALVIKSNTGIIIVLHLVLCIFLFIAAFFYRNSPQTKTVAQTGPEEENDTILTFAKNNKRFLLFLFGIVLSFVAYNICITYLAQIVTLLGGSSENYGALVSLSALMELPTMFLFSRIARRFRCSSLLKVSGVFMFIKCLLIFSAMQLGVGMLYAGQVSQLLGFALYMPASVYYVNLLFPKRNKMKAQAFTSAANMAGGVGGTLLGGFLLDNQGAVTMLLFAVIIAAAGAAFIFTARQEPAGTVKSKA